MHFLQFQGFLELCKNMVLHSTHKNAILSIYRLSYKTVKTFMLFCILFLFIILPNEQNIEIIEIETCTFSKNFPSDFFIIRKDMATAFVEMPCVNKWCIDQVLGEALLAANGLPYIFSHSSTDEMYIDGIVTNYTKRFFN